MSFESSAEINSFNSGKFIQPNHVEQFNHISFILCSEVEDSLEEVEESLVIDETDESVLVETDASGMRLCNFNGKYYFSLPLDHQIHRCR